MHQDVYLYLHILGIGAVFFSLGAFAMRSDDPSKKKLTSVIHGVGLFLLLLGGFGLAAKKGYPVGSTPWIWFKLAVWLGLGGFIAINKRKPELAPKAQVALVLLAMLAAYLGIFHASLGL
jgi:hypothetical protein